MKRPVNVTFYSFKGGVGRTLALLDVAVMLARAGRRVVAVDMDLEAPGFHHYPAIRPRVSDQPGVSDYMLDRLAGGELAIEPFTYRPDVSGVGDRLIIVPAGRRPRELAELIPGLYTPPTERALIFQVFVGRLAAAFAPDFILFDSRTGLAEIAAICTVELADAIVALTGINPQGVDGLVDVIGRIRRHPARDEAPAFILAYSPVPHFAECDIARMARTVSQPGLGVPVMTHPLVTRLAETHASLWTLAVADDEQEVRRRFPALKRADRLHLLRYDPWVPVLGEADFDAPGPLREDHRRLARSVGLLGGHDLMPELAGGAGGSPLTLVERFAGELRGDG
ncbi:MAG: division plane positioning ATPase MipZ [bacterium]